MRLTTTIKRDKWSLYVRTNGHVYRPVLMPFSYPRMQPIYEREWSAVLKKATAAGRPPTEAAWAKLDRTYAYAPDPALFAEGERVAARAITQTPAASIKTPDGRAAEWWSHGSYLEARTGKVQSTELAWSPADPTPPRPVPPCYPSIRIAYQKNLADLMNKS